MSKKYRMINQVKELPSDLNIKMYEDQLWCSSDSCKNYDCFRNPWNIPFGTDMKGEWVFFTGGDAIVWEYNDETTCSKYRTYWRNKEANG